MGGNGGEIIAEKEWSPWPTSETTLRWDLPPARTVVALSVFAVTNDGKPVENRIRSITFLAPDGSRIDLDLKHISP